MTTRREKQLHRQDCLWCATIKHIQSCWYISYDNKNKNHNLVEDMIAYHEMRVFNEESNQLLRKLISAGATPKVIVATL